MAVNVAVNEPFLKHLNVQKTPHVIVSAEDEDFDDKFLESLRNEGFNVQYVPLKGERYMDRVHDTANRMTGINEYYSIVGFGDAAAKVLDHHTHSSPRLVAIIAYYPSFIPDPTRNSYPLNTTILVHLANGSLGIRKRPEILGIQGKPKTVKRRVARGIGLGGEMKFNFPSYKYDSPVGFAEEDLEDHDPIAAELAWSRTLRVLREAFGMKVDIEKIRDEYWEDLRTGNIEKALHLAPDAQVIYTPTLTGGVGKELERFYSQFFRPTPLDLNAKLISRTIGVDRIVDEIQLNFIHDQMIPWLLPDIPPTKQPVEIVIVSIVCIKGGQISHERVYWDQASVLLQVGLLDETNVPEKFKNLVKELPIMGSESARIARGKKEELNELIEKW
ncbi:MAG: hypothetical protein GOMPHAMPRED_005536 [Gomphillus americanus]|uniref:Dienelactone hydrolase n=1 Tax=Gomphillus americanus TaxID=1940652 RepID=A0A8H3FPU3_9LECA|nr:MAG: hypothetical protein GOMPHAMPRED_005536 [Gomphillus americanus]